MKTWMKMMKMGMRRKLGRMEGRGMRGEIGWWGLGGLYTVRRGGVRGDEVGSRVSNLKYTMRLFYVKA
jgi:hypothetical protein